MRPTLAAAVLTASAATAHAQPRPEAESQPHAEARAQARAARPRPPPSSSHYAHYGVALAAETVLSPGDVCPRSAVTPCILGSGGGAVLRGGYRSRGHWYVGGAYEVSRLDSSNLLRLPILQQFRAEARYYWETGTRFSPYGGTGLGAVLYGNEFGTETGGVTTHFGAGVELEVSRVTVIGAMLAYRPLLVRGWTDSTGQRRADAILGFGLAHLWSLELAVEVRAPLSRW